MCAKREENKNTCKFLMEWFPNKDISALGYSPRKIFRVINSMCCLFRTKNSVTKDIKRVVHNQLYTVHQDIPADTYFK